MASHKLSLRFRITASAISLLAFVLVAELTLRATGADSLYQNRFFVVNRALDYPDVFKKDCRLFWRFRPGQVVTSRFFEGKTYRINSAGLRGDEISDVKTGRRILMLGNSCTFGWGVVHGETFARRLGDRLGGEYEVINAGIPGYSSLQGRRFFENELVDLRPDIVVLMFGWNDQWAAASEIADRDQQSPPGIILDCQNLLARLHSYRLLKKLLLSIVESDSDPPFDLSRPVYRVGLADFRANLLAIYRTAEAQGATAILMTSPTPSSTAYGKAVTGSPPVRYHERYNRVVRNLSQSENILLVDAAREFDRHNDLFDNPLSDFIHFNARGHAVIAQLLAERVQSLPVE